MSAVIIIDDIVIEQYNKIKQLIKELSFERRLNDMLKTYKQKSWTLMSDCKCSSNIQLYEELMELNKVYHAFKNSSTVINGCQNNQFVNSEPDQMMLAISSAEELIADTVSTKNNNQNSSQTPNNGSTTELLNQYALTVINPTESVVTSLSVPSTNDSKLHVCDICHQAFYWFAQLVSHQLGEHVIDLTPTASTSGEHNRLAIMAPKTEAPLYHNDTQYKKKCKINTADKLSLKCPTCNYIANSVRGLAIHKVWHIVPNRAVGRPRRQS